MLEDLPGSMVSNLRKHIVHEDMRNTKQSECRKNTLFGVTDEMSCWVSNLLCSG